jgi:predicted acylesterase/phospholipase RssA
MGALRAFDLLATNRTVNDFDIYVGTSAGAFVGSMVANGVTPEEMFRVLDKALPSPIENASLRTLLRPNYKGFAERLALLPLRIAATARRLAGNVGEMSMVDVVMGLAEGLPTGIYHNRGIEEYVRNVLSDPDRTNDFRNLDSELLITATDLDTCERIVFGEGEWDNVERCRSSTSPTSCEAGSSSTAGSSQRPTWTSRWRLVRSSSWSSIRLCPT